MFVPKTYYFIKKYSIGINPPGELKPLNEVVIETRAMRSVFSSLFFVAINRRLFASPWDIAFAVVVFFAFAFFWNWMLKKLGR